VRIAGALVVDLWAADYDNTGATLQTWRNRMAPSASYAEGSFTTTGDALTFPSKTTIQGVTAVVFNGTAANDGVLDRLESGSGWFPDTIYGTSDWALEAWVYAANHLAE
jgi:hypothetical protein